jgi:hypothetical protein
MATDQREWENFCQKASAILRDARDDKISLEQASEFFENDKSISDPDVRRYILYVIWEIAGSPLFYEDLLRLLETRATEAELRQGRHNEGHHWPWD